MRILQVRFKNLNSLVGEWSVDFTHPAFVSDGIFAITGPTGAGKTTILDAICLALYGRTPRLAKVTKSENEIMSRRTGECFAEVLLETRAGNFYCHWSHRRARKKSTGALQDPKHEISDAKTGTVLETKIRQTAEKIETVTGMDFDRFTRSMLLAQGGFAAFLQASPDERAPLLEQITGTEIYSRISIRVHERRGEEREKLNVLQAEADGTALLSPEEEQQLIEDKDRKVQAVAAVDERISQTRTVEKELEEIYQLEEAVKTHARDKEALDSEIAAFAPKQAALDAAMRALELDADYASLTATRTEQQKEQTQLESRNAELPKVETAVQQAESSVAAAAGLLREHRDAFEKKRPAIQKTRTLDIEIEAQNGPIQEADKMIKAHRESIDAVRETQRQDTEALALKRKTLSEVQTALNAAKSDEPLVEQLAGVQSRFDALKLLAERLSNKAAEATQAEKDLQDALSARQTEMNALKSETIALEKIQSEATALHVERSEVLAGREAADWRKEQSALIEQKEQIEIAIAAVSALSESRQAAETLNAQQSELEKKRASLTDALAARSEQQTALETEAALLESNLTLRRRIESLEAERSKLKDGKPCPLCGAIAHPFAEGNLPIPDETEERLGAVRESLKSVAQKISDTRAEQGTTQGDIARVAADRAACIEKGETGAQAIRTACAHLKLEMPTGEPDDALFETLRQLQHDTRKRLGEIARVSDTVETLDARSATLREALDKAKDGVLQKERDAQTAEHKKITSEQAVARLRREADEIEAESAAALAQLRDEVSPFGISALEIDTLDATLDLLTGRRDRWVADNRRKVELEKEIGDLETRTQYQTDTLQKEARALQALRDLQQKRLEKQEDLRRDRRDIFGTENVDEMEARLSDAVKSAEAASDRARQHAVAATQARDRLKDEIDGLKKRIDARAETLRALDAAFAKRLASKGFADAAQYRSATLSENERTRLRTQSESLSSRRTALLSKTRETTERLTEMKQTERDDVRLDDVRDALKTLEKDRAALQEMLGGIRHKLEVNEAGKQRHREHGVRIAAQQRECARWERLHALIGQADGKKFRNFAQGLTFELLVRRADRQLQKMTDRYRLLRDEVDRLELSVMDCYQAGEVRSAKNLSGGESFLVSLALALGLADTAGDRFRVDSLFLDEGFGTLDDDALDTALTTLSALRQEGKIIGVISHVPALKDRIGTQIQVLPQAGGTSRLLGPGCTAAD